MKAQTTMIVLMAVTLIGGIIGFGILDAITADTLDATAVTLEPHTVTGTNGSFTVSYFPIVSVSNVTNNAHNSSMTVGNNYTLTNLVTGTITVTNYNPAQGACCQVSYVYDDGSYLSGGLSRTIIVYLVPIGLLGLLGLAFMFGRK